MRLHKLAHLGNSSQPQLFCFGIDRRSYTHAHKQCA